eukprot:m.485949 g.485949  ORF g.485949 m.485949 type:complete len:80 (-) comp21740_c0_seq2:1506-1745(-)
MSSASRVNRIPIGQPKPLAEITRVVVPAVSTVGGGIDVMQQQSVHAQVSEIHGHVECTGDVPATPLKGNKQATRIARMC